MNRRLINLALAASSAALRHGDEKHYRVGCAAVRGDGTIVSAGNGPTPYPDPAVHAEARLCAKLDYGATVLVVRLRRDGTFGCARPCVVCEQRLVSMNVSRVYYSTGVGEDVESLW